ncbi:MULTISPECIES: DUF2065 family protein [unclassified Lysobacter]|uniref:DUF2065 domain-containing protein n=1 Tax=unclassified Lysobacter TaxID=2635362 RepID=UPI001C2264A0|nr:DUF2065 family protein [Lysobacter sp. MMG2]MBU8975106.1 DUF2065 family protein [Lysobacter sp. MMG2]
MLELVSALCLVAVLEGLFLFVAPRGWKRAAEQLHAMPDRHLRVVGAIVVGLGLLSLWWIRS